MLTLTDLLTQEPFRGIEQAVTAATRNASISAPMDAYRRGDTVWIHIDLPGVAADSIEIDIERSVLTVTAERAWQVQDGDQFYASERRQGTFRRQFHLGQGLDTEAIEANYHDGVLSLLVPVAERAKPRKVEVTRGFDVPGSPEQIASTVDASSEVSDGEASDSEAESSV